MNAALGRADAGRSQVIVIEGEAGIGKSALLATFQDGRGRHAELWARCDEFEADVAFAALALLLDETDLPRSEVAAGRLLLARLSDLQSATDDVIMLVVDDAQWMDRSSARALRFALRRLHSDRVLAIIARRPDPAAGDVDPAPEPTAVVHPSVLGAGAVQELALDLRGWELPHELADRLAQRTGGMPILVAALLRGAEDPSRLFTGGELPPSMAAAARRLLGSVPPAARRLVEASAVLTIPCDLVVLGGVADFYESDDGTDQFLAAAAAETAGLLRAGSFGTFVCAHQLLREAVYEAIPRGRRRRLHARAAQWTVGDRRLAHRAAAADRPDEQLVGELLEAAEVARTGVRYDLAASHRLRARAVCGDPSRRDQLLLEALIDRVDSQQLEGAGELADAAERAAPSALRSLALGVLARDTGRIGPARILLRDAAERALAEDDRTLAERAGIAAAWLYTRVIEGRAAVEAIGDADQSIDPALAGEACTTKGLGLWEAGDTEGALAVLNAARLSPDGASWEADLLAVRGMINMYAGRLDRAMGDFDRSVGMLHLWRPSTNQTRIYVMRSMTRFWLGDWDGAAIDAAAAHAVSDSGIAFWNLPLAHAVSADVLLERGHPGAAAEHVRAAENALAELPPGPATVFVAERRTGLLLANQQYAEAISLMRPLLVGDQLDRFAVFRPHRFLYPAWIHACIKSGRLADAERGLATYGEVLTRWPGGPTPSRLGWLRGQLAESRRDPGAARELYAEELGCPEHQQVPYFRGQLLYAAGRLERVLGNRRAAIDCLDEAWAIFESLRAIPFLRRSAAELRACGRDATVTTLLGLTGREEDVASLVSRGCTNKEIAAELFLTVKSVEYYLSRIYAKVGVKSRHELRRLRAVP